MANGFILPRAVQLMHVFAADEEDDREWLRNVKVSVLRDDGTMEAVATNGHSLVRVVWWSEKNNWHDVPVYFHADMLKEIAALTKTWNSIAHYGFNRGVEIVQPKGESIHYERQRPGFESKNWPDWRSILKHSPDGMLNGPDIFSFSSRLMSLFGNYLQKVWGPTNKDGKQFMHVELAHTDSDGLSPLLLRPHELNKNVVEKDGLLDIELVLMPARPPIARRRQW